jgi:Rps23 Pro-64 3,4-dihydroxylase Tpa1-like proline 4-hydroxylase
MRGATLKNISETPYALSDVLLDDERLISKDERDLLADLLRRSENNPRDTNLEIAQAIANIAGDIVVERAGALLGNSIRRKLTPHGLARQKGMERISENLETTTFPGPRPPTPTPPSPGPGPGFAYEFNSESRMVNLPGPRPPTPTPPSPSPGPGMQYSLGPKGILDPDLATEISLPRCVVLEEFLSMAELNDLLAYTMAHQEQFQVSEVIAPGVYSKSATDFEHRRSHVLMDLGIHQERIVNRLRSTLPWALPRLGIEPFSVSRVEAQITSSQDGDFFRWHSDNGEGEVAARQVTFVYFFHREPKGFEGGELHIQGPHCDNTGQPSQYYTIVPGQNQLVLFDSSLMHEIAPVKCSSGKFADSRFTVNGWFSR